MFYSGIPNSLLNKVNISDLNPHQIRILYILESPLNLPPVRAASDFVNWTATYRRDSVINTPYERFTPYDHNVIATPSVDVNYALNKTKKVAWFVSNCVTRNGRLDYVKELQIYIDVDIYGACGPLKCTRKSHRTCFGYLKKDYKFYLTGLNSIVHSRVISSAKLNSFDRKIHMWALSNHF